MLAAFELPLAQPAVATSIVAPTPTKRYLARLPRIMVSPPLEQVIEVAWRITGSVPTGRFTVSPQRTWRQHETLTRLQ